MNNVVVETTSKRVIVRRSDGTLIGEAGVQNAKDFNFDVLYRLALNQSGSEILG